MKSMNNNENPSGYPYRAVCFEAPCLLYINLPAIENLTKCAEIDSKAPLRLSQAKLRPKQPLFGLCNGAGESIG